MSKISTSSVGFSIAMHLSDSADSNDSGMVNAVNDGNVLVMCRRGWPRVINTDQMEDMHGYG